MIKILFFSEVTASLTFSEREGLINDEKTHFFFFGKHIFMYTYEIEVFMFRETIFGIS